MTTLWESISLMDWLREHREIGLGCMAEHGIYNHHPEYCQEENQDLPGVGARPAFQQLRR